VFIAMSFGVVGVLYAIGMKGSPTAFPVFFVSFLFLFAAAGVGNASTFQMIPAIMRKEVARLEPGLDGLHCYRIRKPPPSSASLCHCALAPSFIPKSLAHRLR
jgi:hypothetical protein